MKRSITLGTAILISAGLLLTGCGDDKSAQKDAGKETSQEAVLDMTGVKDGTFSADSSEAKVGHSHVELTIKDGAITKVVHTGIDKNGNVKAQNAYKAIGSYASQLESKKDLSKVDAVAGATISYDQFKEAVEKAVDEAKK